MEEQYDRIFILFYISSSSYFLKSILLSKDFCVLAKDLLDLFFVMFVYSFGFRFVAMTKC